MSLPPEIQKRYAAIIDKILAESDITTISINSVRKGLQAQVQDDLAPQKALIKELIMSRFDKLDADKLASPPAPQPTPAQSLTNGTSHPIENGTTPPAQKSSPSTSEEQVIDEDARSSAPLNGATEPLQPAKKKRKTEALDADALYAAKLQAEENNRARPTRRGANKKVTPAKKKKSPTKSKAKVKDEDDSDIESGSGAERKRKVNRSGGFHKPLTLSPPLSELLGEITLSRPETVKRIWAYVRERDLQDPNDKRQIRCDDALRTVFKSDRVHMFTMNKILSTHLFAPDE
ncbi:MAG: hypothetical protein M4579_004823 [Chaenotheca gracillima]|nr:MAG: hypothetical protein M4579_004823 [Chaenotheca gracillima]